MHFFSCGRSFGWQALLDLDLESAGDQHFSPCLQIAQGQTYTGIKEKMYRLFIADSAVFERTPSFFRVVGLRCSETETILAIAECSDLNPLLVDDGLPLLSGPVSDAILFRKAVQRMLFVVSP